MLCAGLLAVLVRGGFSGGFTSKGCAANSGSSLFQGRKEKIVQYVSEPADSIVGKCNLKNLSFPDYDIPFRNLSATSSLSSTFKGSIRLQDVLKRIYYINMDRSPSRRTHMEHTLSHFKRRTGIPYKRVRALEADQDAWVQQKKKNMTWPDPNWKFWGGKSNTCLSLHSNHLRAWRLALSQANKYAVPRETTSFVMVLEDDVSINPNSLHKLPKALATVPADVQMLLLGWWGKPRQQDSFNQKRTVYRVSGSRDKNGLMRLVYGGMHAYLLKIDELENLIAFMDEAPMGYSPDGGTLYHPQCMRKYALNPQLVHLKHSLAKKSVHMEVLKGQNH